AFVGYRPRGGGRNATNIDPAPYGSGGNGDVVPSEQLAPQLRPALRREQRRRDVEDRAGTALAALVEPVGRAGIGDEDARREFRVAVQPKRVLHHLRAGVAGLPASDHEAAVGHGGVVAAELLLGDEVDGRVVVGEVIW